LIDSVMDHAVVLVRKILTKKKKIP